MHCSAPESSYSNPARYSTPRPTLPNATSITHRDHRRASGQKLRAAQPEHAKLSFSLAKSRLLDGWCLANPLAVMLPEASLGLRLCTVGGALGGLEPRPSDPKIYTRSCDVYERAVTCGDGRQQCGAEAQQRCVSSRGRIRSTACCCESVLIRLVSGALAVARMLVIMPARPLE